MQTNDQPDGTTVIKLKIQEQRWAKATARLMTRIGRNLDDELESKMAEATAANIETILGRCVVAESKPRAKAGK